MGGSAGVTFLLARGHLNDGPAAVEFEAAAVEQQLFQLVSCALDAGFCAWGGKAKALTHLTPREALPFSEQQRFAILGRQFVEELPNARAQVGSVVRVFRSGREIGGEWFTLAVAGLGVTQRYFRVVLRE